MPRERKTKIVDGYTVFQAARRAEGKEEDTPPRDESPAVQGDGAAPKIASHIGRTVLPTKHDITCYECAYAFQLTGKARSTFCPKCRTEISLRDCRIEGESSEDVKTGATVHVAEGAVVKGGTITANDVILEGRVDGGTLRVYRWLELGPAAWFDPASVDAVHLRVRAEATIKLPALHFRNVEILGGLHTVLTADGRVSIKAGGVLDGEVHGPRLEVEEGGGLRARAYIAKSKDEDDDEA